MSIQDVEIANDPMIYNPAILATAEANTARVMNLPKPGFYKIRVLEAAWRTNRDGERILNFDPATETNRYPQIAIERIEILEPEEFAGRFYVQDSTVMTSPYRWNDRNGNPLQIGTEDDGRAIYMNSCGHVDMLRAFSESEDIGTHFDKLWDTALNTIMQGTPFVCRLGYFAKDKERAMSEIEKATDLNGGEELSKAAKGQHWKNATFKLPDFKDGNGGYHTQLTTSYGAVMDAKLKLGKPVPVSDADNKELGPYQNKRKG